MAKKNITAKADQVIENEVVNEVADNTSGEDNNTSGEEKTEPEVVVPEPKDDGKPKKMTDEEVDFLADALKVDIGIRVKVVPFNTITWEKGTIVGIIADKRSKKVLYAIKLDDGRRIVKTFDSELIQKTNEKVEVVKRGSGNKASTAPKLTEEEMLEIENECAENVGKSVMYVPFKSDIEVEGKITSIVPDRRSGKVLYKIEGLVDGLHKVSHKTSSSEDLKIGDMVDQELQDAFAKRREVRIEKLALTDEEKIAEAEAGLKKLKERSEAIIKQIADSEIELEKMKADYEAAQNATEDAPATEEETTETETEDLN